VESAKARSIGANAPEGVSQFGQIDLRLEEKSRPIRVS
jgi:hypothetical protein